MVQNYKNLTIILTVLFTAWLPSVPLSAHAELTSGSVAALKSDIFANLKSSMRGMGLQRKLAFFQYKVKKDENFFQVVTRFAQDPDTIASLNELANPASVREGTVLVIPNARGIFTEEHTEADCVRVQLEKRKLCFLPGRRFSVKERLYFQGDIFAHPLPGSVLTSRYGSRIDPIHRKRSFHGGIDLAAPVGEPVRAVQDGTVAFAGKKGGYGNLVIVKHEYGYYSYHGHLSKISVKKGQRISMSSKLGEVGKTGRVTGPHLHFELRKATSKLNPLNYFRHE